MAKDASKVGRPRCFVKDEKLDAAAQVFIKHGFEGASLDDLTAALGINKPSLYAAFGNKEEFFIAVMKKYHDVYCGFFQELLDQDKGAKQTIETWLGWFLDNYKNQGNRDGCLIVNSTLLASENYPKIAEQLKSFHDLNEKLMSDYLEKEKEKGRFNGDPVSTSQFYNAIVQGMAVLHRTQRNYDALKNIADGALRAWPG